MGRGTLITFEGIEGAGKSSQLEFLAKRLRAAGRNVLAIREPGGTELGEGIRRLLKGKETPLCGEAELLLFLASRAQLVRERIRPALADGTIVLCDRYSDSTLAYQWGARGLPIELVKELDRFAAAACVPDRTILLDLPPEEGFRRIRAARGGPLDRFEEEPLAFFQKVRAAYLQIVQENPHRIVTIDGSQSPKAVELAVAAAVRELLF
ncbi:MAG: dTMP kinase [Puniceicoccales bacterium]|jgi:dTMP kinase|nr:dTMP kinase [Puniceicoccales bacterium]